MIENKIVKKLLTTLFALTISSSAFADIMYTYRPMDDKSKGFVVVETLKGNKMPADSTNVFGEYDLYEKGKNQVSLYYRHQSGNMMGANNIKALGLKYLHQPHKKFKIGALVNVTDRDPFLEYDGLSYRVMPIAEVNVIRGLDLRFLHEIEIIPKGTIKDEDTVAGMAGANYKNSQERAYYIRIGFNDLTRGWIEKSGFIKDIAYEEKRANGKDPENPSKFLSKWSREKFWFVTLPNDVVLYRSHIAEYDAFGIMFKF